MALNQKNLSLTLKTPLGDDKLILKRFNAEEGMSGLFQFDLEMISDDNSLSFDKIVGESVTVTMKLADESEEYFNGIVSRFKQYGSDVDNTRYFAEVVPKLWLLKLNRDSRIFQNQSAPDIIKAILEEHGLSDVRDSIEQVHSVREYCVQYQESAFDFISRLMEDEGIFYYFEHDADKHTLILSDASSRFDKCQLSDIRVKSSESGEIEEDVITQCSLEHVVGPSDYVLNDFDYTNPSSPLHANVSSKVEPNSKMEIFDYPGGYDSNDAGGAKAQWRIEEKELAREFLQGSGYCRAFRPGFKFCLKDHDRADWNQEYVLSDVSHSVTQEKYSNSFTAFLDGKPFRPANHTAKPVIPGAQTAIVVGPSGEEIYTDNLGRIKVQFHWDRKGENDDKSSCWIRVAQGMAGQGWGGCFLPRIKQEVVVSFLEGNPDRPLVTGAVYNGDNDVPLSLPDEATRSTIKTNSSKGGNGSNEIRFEDLADSEELYIHAQKDMNTEVENDYSRNILHDETHTIKNDRTLTVQEGNETLEVTKGNRSLTVGGDETISVTGARTLEVKGDETHSVEGALTHSVTGDETHSTDGSLTQSVKGDVTNSTDGGLTQKVSGDYLLDVSGSITIKAGGSITIDAGQSLTQKSGMDASCTAGTSLDLKAGTSGNIEGGTGLALKGATIKLN